MSTSLEDGTLVCSHAMSTPPAHALARRGIVQNVRGYMLYGDYREPHPASAIIDAVEDGDVDVAVVSTILPSITCRFCRRPLNRTEKDSQFF